MTYPQHPHNTGNTGQHWGPPPGHGQGRPHHPGPQPWGPRSGEPYPAQGYYGQPSGQGPLQGQIPNQQSYGHAPTGGHHRSYEQHSGYNRRPAPQGPPLKKPMSAGKKVLIGVGGFVGVLILLGALSGGGDDNTTTTATESTSAADTTSVPTAGGGSVAVEQPAAAPAAPPAFPGAENGDLATDPGGQLTTEDGLTLTATALTPGNDFFGDTLCTDVSYSNGSDDTVSYNIFDWDLITPQGQIVTAGFTGGTDSGLGAGDLLPGGTTSGEVCFEGAGGGRFVVLFEQPSFFTNGRLAWINQR